MGDRYRPARGPPPVYRFGKDQGQALRGFNRRQPPPPGTFDFRAPGSQNTPDFSAQQQHQPAKNRRSANNYRGQPRRQFRARPGPSERPLMQQTDREPTPELMKGMTTGAKFKAIDDVSDDDSASNDIGSSSEESDDNADSRTARTAKRARLTSKDQVDLKNEQKPKWSNPDPYYNNPPTFDASKKKTDVVKLIRKRRAEEAPVKPKTSSAEDFIAFNFSDDDSEESVVEVVEPLSTTAGTSRRTLNTFSHLDNLHPDRMKKKSDVLKTEVIEILDDGDDPDPPRGTSINVWPPPLPAPVVSESKGKRKREEDDRPAQVTAVSTSWRAKAGHIAVPWWQPRPGLTVEQSLHQEILDFYSFVQPRDFERQQRHLLIHNLQGFLNQTYHYEQASVMYFGSYGAGLYLPDGDMDLVIRSQRFSKGGDPSIGQGRRPMNRFADDLVRQGIARRGSVIVIHKSKVPIIKYIDNLTGLHVDISFENDTGPIANGTYTMWTTQYPALPMMVSLVKQFLHMRSLNDVANGGIGGFTITCLVVSMLQLNPQLSSANLGTMFLHFLDLYGNKFDTTTYGICLNPPGHFRKAGTHLRLNPSRPWALSIQDPNKPDNDISGGSHNVRFILKTFSEAHRALTQVMDQARKSRTSGDCLLHCILAGDYSSYTRQRNRLRDLANRP